MATRKHEKLVKKVSSITQYQKHLTLKYLKCLLLRMFEKEIALFVTIISAGIILFAGLSVAAQLYDQRETIQPAVEHTIDGIVQLCGIEDRVMNEMNQTLANSLIDPQAREIANKILDGEALSDCEWHEFINHLNEWEKRKLRIHDFVCDLTTCLK